MRVILSRKGFDSGAGGRANPILPCGKPVSIPIPGVHEPYRYRDITLGGRSGADVVEALTNGRIKGKHLCHLDPDLDADSCVRNVPFQAAFGQTGAAARHLANENIREGDLFLFFGWFRQTEERDGKLRFVPGAADIHVIYGYMQVGRILKGEALAEEIRLNPSVAAHPHAMPRHRNQPLNTIILPAEELIIDGKATGLSGAGTFKSVRSSRILTAGGMSRTWWLLPHFFHPQHGTRLSYHDDTSRWIKSDSGVLLKSAARGQEFVLHTSMTMELNSWLDDIFGFSAA